MIDEHSEQVHFSIIPSFFLELYIQSADLNGRAKGPNLRSGKGKQTNSVMQPSMLASITYVPNALDSRLEAGAQESPTPSVPYVLNLPDLCFCCAGSFGP